MRPEEKERIVASLAKFYDYVVEKGGRDVPEDRIATVLSEAALVDHKTTCFLLRDAKQLAERTLDSVIMVHRERIMLADYYAQNPPPPEKEREADGYKRYADHYRIGLNRGRDVCFSPSRSSAAYPTAVELERLHTSRFMQYMTLGPAEFAQPDQLATHIPQLAAPPPRTPPPAPPAHQPVLPVPAAGQQIPAAYHPLGHYAPYGAPHPAPALARPVPGVHPSAGAYAAYYGAPRAAAAPAAQHLAPAPAAWHPAHVAWHPAAAARHPATGPGPGAYPPAGGRAPHPGVPQPGFSHPGVPQLGGAYGGVYRAPAPNQHQGPRPGQ